MDTFGRLPNELIEQITCLFELPEIDIIDNINTFYFIVKYRLITTKLRMIARLKWYSGTWVYYVDDDIEQFINNISDDIDCIYDEDEFTYKQGEVWENFNIEFINNRFKIYNAVSEVILPIECKDQLIKAMGKYQLLLNTYV